MTLLLKQKGHSALAHNKKFFVVGGCDQTEIISSVEVYSADANEITFVKSTNQGRAFFGCCFFNASLNVIGGFLEVEDHKFTDGVEIYDIENDMWEKGPKLPMKLTGMGCSTTEYRYILHTS